MGSPRSRGQFFSTLPLKAVVPTDESASHKGDALVQEITEVCWNSGPQMVMHCPKCKTILWIAYRQKRTSKL